MLLSLMTRVRRLFGKPKVSLVKDLTTPSAVEQSGRANAYRFFRVLDAEMISTGAVSLSRRVSLVKDLTTPGAVRQLHWAAATRALRMIELSRSSNGVVKLHRSELLPAR